MTPELAKAWADDLCSGKYEQTQNVLHRECGRRCCLGVLLSTMGVEPDKNTILLPNGERAFTYETGMWGSLSTNLLEKAGMSHEEMESFIHMNDSEGLPFEEIALRVRIRYLRSVTGV